MRLRYLSGYEAKPQCQNTTKAPFFVGNAVPSCGDRKSRVPVRLANLSLPGHWSDPPETHHSLHHRRSLRSEELHQHAGAGIKRRDPQPRERFSLRSPTQRHRQHPRSPANSSRIGLFSCFRCAGFTKRRTKKPCIFEPKQPSIRAASLKR